MIFPGRRTLELTVDIRYCDPCYLGDTVRLRARVEQLMESLLIRKNMEAGQAQKINKNLNLTLQDLTQLL